MGRPLFLAQWVVGLLLVGRGATPLAAQAKPPNFPSSGGFTSRFVPTGTWSRMKESLAQSPNGILVSAPIDSVWVQLRKVLDNLAVPVTFDEKATWQMGTPQSRMFRKMGKERLSAYLQCGEGITGPNADSYSVYFTSISFLVPQADGTVGLFTLLSAQAVDAAGGRNDPIDCSSTGRLEQRIADQVKLRSVLGAAK